MPIKIELPFEYGQRVFVRVKHGKVACHVGVGTINHVESYKDWIRVHLSMKHESGTVPFDTGDVFASWTDACLAAFGVDTVTADERLTNALKAHAEQDAGIRQSCLNCATYGTAFPAGVVACYNSTRSIYDCPKWVYRDTSFVALGAVRGDTSFIPRGTDREAPTPDEPDCDACIHVDKGASLAPCNKCCRYQTAPYFQRKPRPDEESTDE